jgi:hypothetical protein
MRFCSEQGVGPRRGNAVAGRNQLTPSIGRRCCLRPQSREAAGESSQRRGDGAADSPGAGAWRPCRAIDTAHARNKDDTRRCGPHRRYAGCHHLPCAVQWQRDSPPPDSAACRLVEVQNPAQRSGPISRAEPKQPVDIRKWESGLLPQRTTAGLARTRWCAAAPAPIDGPVPGASFHTHCEMICHTSWPAGE